MNEWYESHKRLGCNGCKFADEKCLGMKPCCTFAGKLAVDGETGKCLSKREK